MKTKAIDLFVETCEECGGKMWVKVAHARNDCLDGYKACMLSVRMVCDSCGEEVTYRLVARERFKRLKPEKHSYGEALELPKDESDE